jgi:hypothetical protein
MNISAPECIDRVATRCCDQLLDIECVTACEFTGDELCSDHTVFIDDKMLKFGIVRLLDEKELAGRNFTLTFRKLAKGIQDEIFGRGNLSQSDINKAITVACEKYYRGEFNATD